VQPGSEGQLHLPPGPTCCENPCGELD
jgi:hypothetical protein